MRDLLTVQEAAAYLRLSPQSVREMCRTGKLPAVRVGPKAGMWRIDLTAGTINGPINGTNNGTIHAAPREEVA